MSFLTHLSEFIFGKTIRVEDSFFGELIDVDDYYEGRRNFGPIGGIVEIGLAKTSTTSNDKQVAFFRWLEESYDLIIDRVSPLIEKKVAEWIPNYRIIDFSTEFQLEYISIPSCEEEVKEWGISFFAVNELQHWCSLEMRDMEITSILIDG